MGGRAEEVNILLVAQSPDAVEDGVDRHPAAARGARERVGAEDLSQQVAPRNPGLLRTPREVNAPHQVRHVVVLRFARRRDDQAAQARRWCQDAVVVDEVPARLGEERHEAGDELLGGEEEAA